MSARGGLRNAGQRCPLESSSIRAPIAYGIVHDPHHRGANTPRPFGNSCNICGFRTERHASASRPRGRIYAASIARAGERRFFNVAWLRAELDGYRSEAGQVRPKRIALLTIRRRSACFTWKTVRAQVDFQQTLPVNGNLQRAQQWQGAGRDRDCLFGGCPEYHWCLIRSDRGLFARQVDDSAGRPVMGESRSTRPLCPPTSDASIPLEGGPFIRKRLKLAGASLAVFIRHEEFYRTAEQRAIELRERADAIS